MKTTVLNTVLNNKVVVLNIAGRFNLQIKNCDNFQIFTLKVNNVMRNPLFVPNDDLVSKTSLLKIDDYYTVKVDKINKNNTTFEVIQTF